MSSRNPNMSSLPNTFDDLVADATKDYLSTIDKEKPIDVRSIKNDLYEILQTLVQTHNAAYPKEKWQMPKTLASNQIIHTILTLYPICRLIYTDKADASSVGELALYQSDGPDEGIYVADENAMKNLIFQYNELISESQLHYVMTMLYSKAPVRTRTMDRDLIAVNNGVFNYATKELLPFSPDYIFTSKSRVDYNPAAINPVIHNDDDGTDWDVESWMESLSDDPEIITLLWEMLGAIIRPYVAWDVSAWMYSEKGNNGKGTLCELMRNLCGEGSYATIPLTNFSKDFMLEQLTRVSAIITDENAVGAFIDTTDNLKAVITGDVIQLNRKYQKPISYKFHGFMVQCINDLPRIRDKSDSIYRRQLFIPMTKCFTGHVRKYIKGDYLKRTEVLEYVLKKILNTDYYSLSFPDACKNTLEEYKEFNDPIQEYFNEFSQEFAWDLVPFPFMYDLYKKWLAATNPKGAPVGRNTFIRQICNIVQNDETWYCQDSKASVRSKGRMEKPEMLIIRYDLEDWKNIKYHGHDPDIICRTVPAISYRGILRYESTNQDEKPYTEEI